MVLSQQASLLVAPLDATLLRWQFGLPPVAPVPDGSAMASSSTASFDLFNFDSCGFSDPDGALTR